MLKEEIVVGKAYVNERASLVIEEVDNRHVRYIAFELESGRLLPARHSTCGKAELRRWGDREIEPHEQARIHPYQANAPAESNPSAGYHLRPEEARAVADGAPGAHTFPIMK